MWWGWGRAYLVRAEERMPGVIDPCIGSYPGVERVEFALFPYVSIYTNLLSEAPCEAPRDRPTDMALPDR